MPVTLQNTDSPFYSEYYLLVARFIRERYPQQSAQYNLDENSLLVRHYAHHLGDTFSRLHSLTIHRADLLKRRKIFDVVALYTEGSHANFISDFKRLSFDMFLHVEASAHLVPYAKDYILLSQELINRAGHAFASKTLYAQTGKDFIAHFNNQRIEKDIDEALRSGRFTLQELFDFCYLSEENAREFLDKLGLPQRNPSALSFA